jgi:uncharacterized protein (DUF111 family)
MLDCHGRQFIYKFDPMQLFINPSGGLSGKSFATALMVAGAPTTTLVDAMHRAASRLVKCTVQLVDDGHNRPFLHVVSAPADAHLTLHEAKHLLAAMFEELELAPQYRDFGLSTVHLLANAVNQVYGNAAMTVDLANRHAAVADVNQLLFHEAQHIVVDITAAALGLQLLDAPVSASLLAPVNVLTHHHSKCIDCHQLPHGTTAYLLQQAEIAYHVVEEPEVACTPIAAAILVALEAKQVYSLPTPSNANPLVLLQ